MKKNTLLKKTIEQVLRGRKLVLVSNRGPVQFDVDAAGRRRWRRGAGGLITALHSVLTTTKALWVAAAMSDEDRLVAREDALIGLPEDDPLYWIYLVDIPPATYDLYYNQISNKVLWFLHHYLFDALRQPSFDKEVKRAWSEGYVDVNRRFAEKVAAITQDDPRPIVLIQDYHLYLVAGWLRQLKPDALLFHFVHVPWCSPDYFKFLPSEIRQKILESLLANDIVGLHSWRYARNFMHCCQDFLGCRIDLRHHKVFVGDRVVYVKAYPISISVEELTAIADSPEVAEEKIKFMKLKAKYQLIVRIDRAELSKNLIRGFEAYALLLKDHPELRGKIKFLAYAYPTRESLSEYRTYRAAIEAIVERINTEFGDDSWQPVELGIEDNYHRSVAAMSTFDVLLTNPVFDGMNLVAKEASVLNMSDGVIVLSENAGAYEELRDGVLGVNPFDIEDTKNKLYQALTMTPLERGLRANRLREIVERNDVLKWLLHQLKDIEKVSKSSAIYQPREETRDLVN
ncbi:MAG: trehalose-6-phosphate synthase [Actinomycetota bacterium]|nr:trehalose-6-phosphate synthase [Actinomycetota bacterium]